MDENAESKRSLLESVSKALIGLGVLSIFIHLLVRWMVISYGGGYELYGVPFVNSDLLSRTLIK